MADSEQAPSVPTLRQHVLEAVERVLQQEGFPTCALAPIGILNLVDAIASYHEEGKELFPHIVIATSLTDLLKPLPFAHRVDIQRMSLTPEGFARSLRLCAPLAVDGWVIFVELDIEHDAMLSGLISAELSDTSPSLYSQLIGEMAPEITTPALYLSNVGQRTVLLEGRKSKLPVSLTLKEAPASSSNQTREMVSLLCGDCSTGTSKAFAYFLEKHLDATLKDCHGALIAVVNDDATAIAAVKELMPDGVYLPDPVNLALDFEDCESAKTREAATKLRVYSGIVRNMLRSDGITVFTTTGKALAYHCIIRVSEAPGSIGGTRSRAFKAMTESGAFVGCYYRSQDGHEDIWRKT